MVSGGFMPLVESVQARLGLDHAFANHVRDPNRRLERSPRTQRRGLMPPEGFAPLCVGLLDSSRCRPTV